MSKDAGRWVRRGLHFVTFADGPREGSWETMVGWAQTRELASLNGETPDHGRTLGYEPTEQVKDHARFPEAQAQVWTWKP